MGFFFLQDCDNEEDSRPVQLVEPSRFVPAPQTRTLLLVLGPGSFRSLMCALWRSRAPKHPACLLKYTSRECAKVFFYSDVQTKPFLLVCVSLQKNPTDDSCKKAVAEGQRRARVVAQRGKSMEELGTSKMARLPAISKSSEQLDQLGSLSGPVGFIGEKRNPSVFAEARRAQSQGREGMAESVPQQAAEEPESFPITPGAPASNQTQRKSSLKHNPEPEEDPTATSRDSSRSTSPTSPSTSRIGLPPGSHGPPSEPLSNPPSPRALETGGCGSRSVPPSPTQTTPPCESRCLTRSENALPQSSVSFLNADMLKRRWFYIAVCACLNTHARLTLGFFF